MSVNPNSIENMAFYSCKAGEAARQPWVQKLGLSVQLPK